MGFLGKGLPPNDITTCDTEIIHCDNKKSTTQKKSTCNVLSVENKRIQADMLKWTLAFFNIKLLAVLWHFR